jgi:hypothetical protein
MLEHTEAMLTMLPPPAASMAGRNAWIRRYIDFTFRFIEKS